MKHSYQVALALKYVLGAVLACLFCCCVLWGCGPAEKPQDSTEMNVDTSNKPLSDDIKPAETDYSSLKAQISSIVSEYSSGSKVSVTFRGLGAKVGGFDINGSAPLASASMIKMAVLAELFNQVQAGNIPFDSSITVSSSDVVGGAGTGISAGQTLTVRELTRRMISESDNTASNVLVSKLGIENINQNAARMGLNEVLLDHKFMTPNITQDNLISSNNLSSIFEKIAKDELGGSSLDDAAKQFLLAQSDNEALSKGITQPWRLGHKTGSLLYARNDGGIIYDASGNAACVLVVLTNDMSESTANKMMARIATVVCNYMGEH